jgi:16S rRNA (guanine527-N7)-methyltransferase
VTQPAPAVAATVFGAGLPEAVRYADLLATEGLVRGLLGPREAERIWDRHLLNSAVVAELLPAGAQVVDVGSGAGLPGIPVALARPDVRVVLLEPLARRCAFLQEAVDSLGLSDRVRVQRGRAPDAADSWPFLMDYALARAVAPMDRLVSWTMPLVAPGGELLAVRGERAEQDLQAAQPGMARLGAGAGQVVEVGADLLGAPVRVVRVPRKQTAGRKADRRGRGHRRQHRRTGGGAG